MIRAPQLLTDLTRLLKRIEDDLRQRIVELAELRASLQAEWQAAQDANRTAETFETWAEQVITQAGVHWLLSCVFLRFIEDNQLVDRPWLSGTPAGGPFGDRLALARDRHQAYFSSHPTLNDRDYLLQVFTEAGTLPGLHTFFDAAHNPVFRLGISGDAAMAVIKFWQQVDPNTGALVHDFTDPTWNTRFLGDLYQDLSEATRKRYALLQTPEFVEEFILDRTLTPAIREFGYREVRMIDPTCGSGHFLLGGFQRLVDEWSRNEPTRNRRDIAQKALDAVAGVDLNPFAVAIARFRLLVAALRASDVHRLADAPDFRISVAIGDSLLHGQRFGLAGQTGIKSDDLFDAAVSHADTGLAHAYASEDLTEVRRILGRQYHAVVGNPPYIVMRDAALNAAYRSEYASCHRQYSLGCPFTERFFEMAVTGQTGKQSAGFIGLITTNSFMKREFGSKLIEDVLPRVDLTHVIDTSVASIPGHGTPTVILLGRHQAPVADTIRAVMGIKGEPNPPADPSRGLVWLAIIDQVDRSGSESEFISVADTARTFFSRHPWSLVGGGAADLKDAIESGRETLRAAGADLGYHVITGEDNCLMLPASAVRRLGLTHVRPIIEGDCIRDWSCDAADVVLWPYSLNGADLAAPAVENHIRFLWPYRCSLKERRAFGVPVEQRGLRWWDIREIYRSRLQTQLTISIAFVATNNHCFLERGERVFKQSAPVVKLPIHATDTDYLRLLSLLNSSTACFWFHQVCHNKGGPGGGSSKDEKWHDFYEFASTPLAEFPLAVGGPVELARQLESVSTELAGLLPVRQLMAISDSAALPTKASFDAARGSTEQLQRRMIALQEELDWNCYSIYGVLPATGRSEDYCMSNPPDVAIGERAFEIVLARRRAAGRVETRWFEWLGIEPITEIPARWAEPYRTIVKRRIELIEQDRHIGLLESMACKRRWESPGWEDLVNVALREWLHDRLESPRYWRRLDAFTTDQPPELSSTSRLADAARHDADFMQIAALYAGHADFDPTNLVAELVTSESVPFLPVQRYTETGLRKRAQWQDTWALQRREDLIDAQVDDNADDWRQELAAQACESFGSDSTEAATSWINKALAEEIARQKAERKEMEVGKIPVPPKYQSKDFIKSGFWRLRGGLDVPKERWISYPSCERGADGSLVLAWAGWTHLQQATALAGAYLDRKENEGWSPERLAPLLAGLLELLPWLKQWHNDLDPHFGERMGDYYADFVTQEARSLGFTLDALRAWQPRAAAVKRGRKPGVRKTGG